MGMISIDLYNIHTSQKFGSQQSVFANIRILFPFFVDGPMLWEAFSSTREKKAVPAFTRLLCLENETCQFSEILTFQFTLTWFHNPEKISNVFIEVC